ncbi:hypothetical protein RJ45_09845 [Photobacterium gaetbulicola]|uniref:DUF2860 domain-containing protein n=1 Tax=Photobacterium gaetbulicola TaxID=1295392 RepID=A0A0B9GYM3_9GAMM|nr:DUF2860 family protein [Photobacterium gaetbulicola]KHT63816.1 hypothetical protein RJ45_09845 [Photobacterium gaetbulicola]
MRNLNIFVIALFAGFTTSAYALDNSRINGDISINTGYATSNSNLNPNGDKTLSSLDDRVSHTNNYFAAPLGNIRYALDSNHTHAVYLGTSRDDLAVGTLAFELGYQYNFTNGTQLDITYLPTVLPDEVWANPYLTGEERQTTDIDGNAYRLKLSNLLNTGVSLDMAYATATIDDEQITESTLFRDSATFYLKGQHLSMLDQRSGLITAFSYTDHNAEGKAASYNKYKVEMTYFLHSSAYSLALTGSYAYRQFDAVNPLFDTLRNDDVMRLFLAYEYKDIPGWDNWSVTSLAGSTVTSSNIDFYKSNNFLMTVGLNYQF